MAKLKKSELASLSNKEMAKTLDLSEKKLKTAFKNYNKLLDYIDSGGKAAPDKMDMFLDLTETPGKKDVGLKLAERLLEKGKLEKSVSELVAIRGFNLGTLNVLINQLQELEIPKEKDKKKEIERERNKRRTPRPYIGFDTAMDLFNGINGDLVLNMGSQLFFSGKAEKIKEKVGKIKELVNSGKAADEIKKEILQQTKDIEAEVSGSSGERGTSTPPRRFERNTNGFIEDDEYFDLYGEALEKEELYTVWLDRVMAYEVDGIGDDNVFWTAQVTVYMKNPRKIIRTSFISEVYNIDEREEYRLKPAGPIEGQRAYPLANDEWKRRGFILRNDAQFALKVNGNIRGIPLSKLSRIEISMSLYETDSVKDLIKLVSQLGAAVIAILGIAGGRFAPAIDKISGLSDKVKEALEKLNELISSDELLLEDGFTFRPNDFKNAFKSGKVFDYPRNGSKVALGMPFQRVAQAELETGSIIDTGEIDTFLGNFTNDQKDKDFYEDKFESFYEVQMRFEKTPPS